MVVGQAAALKLLAQEGIENVWKRTTNWRRTRARSYREARPALLAKNPANILTGVILPEGVDGHKLLADILREEGISIAGGQLHLKGKIFRLAHMGTSKSDVDAGVAALSRAWRRSRPDMSKLTVLVTDKIIDPEGLKPLQHHAGIDLRYEIAPKPEVLEKALGRRRRVARALETKITSDWIGKAPDLRLIGRAGVRVDNIDLPAATRRGVAVINAPAANTLAAAEHTMALMLALARHVPQADATTKAGKWERSEYMGVELFGKTLGVVGLGRIGREVAKRAQAFGMKIVGYDPFVTEAQARELGIEPAPLADLLARVNFTTLHVPGGDKTKHLISAESLKTVKKGLRLVNCARGELIDEHALAEALRDGRVGGAALDVFSEEPLPAQPPPRRAEPRAHAPSGRLDQGGPEPRRHRARPGRRGLPREGHRAQRC